MTFPVLGSVDRPSYTDTRGLYLSYVDHIIIRGNTIHHTPGNGLRVADCEYIDILENEIHDCSRKSYSGTHAMVVTKAISTDNIDNYKINILRNEVHHNYNEIYSWSPLKTFITPRIDEGKGISMQRNSEEAWTHGRFLIANNLCYWNGFSGVHTNTGKRMDFINNTCYYNSYTNTITYAGGNQTGNNIGISAQESEDIRMINNVVFIDNAWGGFPISVANTGNFTVYDNMVFGDNGPLNQDGGVFAVRVDTTVSDPLFENPEQFDFHLKATSPAIGVANASFAPDNDFYGNPRDASPDLGAIEYDSIVGIGENYTATNPMVYPNPFSSILNIIYPGEIGLVEVYTLTGQKIHTGNIMPNKNKIDLSFLERGCYLLRVNNSGITIIKE